jgi:hypothetical protein
MDKKGRRALWGGALLIIAGLLGGSVAMAQETGGVKVKGNTQLNVNANNINTVATGTGNVARTTIGAVKGSTHQSTNVTVDVKNVSNVAAGRNRKSCVNIGVVGADPNCK